MPLNDNDNRPKMQIHVETECLNKDLGKCQPLITAIFPQNSAFCRTENVEIFQYKSVDDWDLHQREEVTQGCQNFLNQILDTSPNSNSLEIQRFLDWIS